MFWLDIITKTRFLALLQIVFFRLTVFWIFTSVLSTPNTQMHNNNTTAVGYISIIKMNRTMQPKQSVQISYSAYRTCQQEAQLPQRNSASAAHTCLPRLANTVQCTEHCRIAEVVLFLTFKRSDSRSAGRKRILSWNSHSMSFEVIHLAIICRSTRGSISSYNMACRISEVFEDVAT